MHQNGYSFFKNFPGVTPPDPRQVLGPTLHLKEPPTGNPGYGPDVVMLFRTVYRFQLSTALSILSVTNVRVYLKKVD